MNIDVTGHRALVTGSTAGIGFEIASVLAECGAAVVVNGRKAESVDETVRALQAQFPDVEITGAAGDVGTRAGVAQIIEQAGDVDILVNNAAIYGAKAFVDVDDSEWQEYWDVNVMSAVRLSRHYAPLMAKSDWGRIVMISSESAIQIHHEMVHYGTSKIALIALARGIAQSYPGTGLTVNSIVPGPTRSRGVNTFLESEAVRKNLSVAEIEKRWVAKWRPTSVTRKVADGRDVAAMVAFICSPLAAATTGATLRVDGGVIPTIP